MVEMLVLLPYSLPCAFQLGSSLQSVQSVTTDELEPELMGLVESESETELPTLSNFSPDQVGGGRGTR